MGANSPDSLSNQPLYGRALSSSPSNQRLCEEIDDVAAVRIDDGLISGLYVVRNPEKLSRVINLPHQADMPHATHTEPRPRVADCNRRWIVRLLIHAP